MTSKRMTDAQTAAVNQVEGDLAISAGAGSGKTTVLAHRFATAMSTTANASWAPAAVDQILTITFTKKAAGEIAERVRRVVNTEVSREAGRRVGEAWISTFHTFCGRLVRRHLLESGVEPGFLQLDEVGAASIAAEAFEAACAGLYEEDEDTRRLIDRWGASTLNAAISAAHENVRAMGLSPAEIKVPNDNAGLAELLAKSIEAAVVYSAELAEVKQTPSVAERAAGLSSWCDAMSVCPIDDDLCARIQERAAEGGTLRMKSSAARDDYRCAREALEMATAAVADPGLYSAMERLLRAYAEQYSAIKQQRGALDFDDLQERAVSLLTDHPGVAEQYRSRFRMLMVDEFQDTNDLQMRVLNPLRDDNLCIVGDERQSIYGFRYADVKVFERIRTELGKAIELAENFRSHPGVMSVVNEMFSMPHLFDPRFMKLAAGRTAGWKLQMAAEAPRVECLLVGLDAVNIEAAREVEAEHIAKRVAELVSEGELHGEDIAILLRSGGRASLYARALERRGIPVLVSAGASLYDARETGEILSMLRAIAVPTDDEALLQLLGNRFVALSDDALLAVRAGAPKGEPLFSGLRAVAMNSGGDGLSAPDRDAATHAYEVVERFGHEQGRLGIAELLHRACEQFDYDLTLFAQGAEGVRAWANVLKLARVADVFEDSGSGDLAAFVAHLRDRQANAKDKSAAADAGRDAVRIMTIHAAKGLEFPVVFAADLASPKSRSCDNLLVGREIVDGRQIPVVGVSVPNGPLGRAATAAHLRMSPEVRVAAVEEEKRCLYVAATRAEELLVISGATRIGKPASEGGSLIDWVREALGDPDVSGSVTLGSASVAVTVIDPAENPPEPPEPELARIAPPFATPTPGARPQALTGGYPQSVSYSALHIHECCPLAYHVRYVLRLGKFSDPAVRSSTDLGSALHAVLETMPAEGTSSAALRDASERFRLPDDERERLEHAVNDFTGSDIAQRLFSGEPLRREEPLRVRLGATALVGSIDAIAWDGQSAYVVDYKTGRGPDKADSPRLDAYKLQARCYALAAFESGAHHVEVAFCFVEHGARTITHQFERERDHATIRNDISDRITRVSEQNSTHLPRYEENVCGGCPALGGLCPIDAPTQAV